MPRVKAEMVKDGVWLVYISEQEYKKEDGG